MRPPEAFCLVLLMAFTGCASARWSSAARGPAPLGRPVAASGIGADRNSASTGGAPAGTYARTRNVARELRTRAQQYRVAQLSRRSLTHRRFWDTIGPLIDEAAGMHREEIGRSLDERALYAVYAGRGPVRVLLWSQMHGNEPTATLALADLFNFLGASAGDPLVRRLRERLTIVAIPMLNPDGAERSTRENAAGIDLNRDARTQVSPEARALAALHARFKPRFAFNLHDQARRVGDDGRLVAISLLAPPRDRRRSAGGTLNRAKRVAAVMRVAADFLVDGRVTRFHDAYNPHAFGDAMQTWGTSTVLLESGVWDDEPDNEYLRHVNFALLLTALDAIATGSYVRAALEDYESLPANPTRTSHPR